MEYMTANLTHGEWIVENLLNFYANQGWILLTVDMGIAYFYRVKNEKPVD